HRTSAAFSQPQHSVEKAIRQLLPSALQSLFAVAIHETQHEGGQPKLDGAEKACSGQERLQLRLELAFLLSLREHPLGDLNHLDEGRLAVATCPGGVFCELLPDPPP